MHASLGMGAIDELRVASRVTKQSLLRFLRNISLLGLCFAASANALAASNVVQYTYDTAGNITNIQRQSDAGFAITSFTPTSGPIGTAVTIYGAGFDPTPANNVVKFNGIVATVTASASGSISTAIPSGATTGPISVTVGTSTATSSQPFTVTVPGAPTISSFSPTIGAVTTTVTVNGSNFDTAAGATTVKINGVTATTTVSDPSTLTFTVPASAASGALTVITSVGTGTASTDFIVPPAGINASDITSSIRIAPGAPNASISVPAGSKNGIVLFDLQPSVYYSIQLGAIALSPTSATAAYKLIKPDNTVLQSGSIGGSNSPSIHLPLFAAGGTYSLVLSPGTATLNANVRVEVNPIVTIDGPSAASTLDFANQSARFVFDATAIQRLGLGLVGVAFTPTVPYLGAMQVFRSDGTLVTLPQVMDCWTAGSGNPEGNCDGELIVPATGRYTAIFTPPTGTYATFAFQLSSAVTGTLTADVSQPVTLARVGQDAYYTFTANAGDSLGIDLSNFAMQPRPQRVSVTVYKPDGTSLGSYSATPPNTVYLELGTVATTGTYSVSVDPDVGAYGTFNLNLKQGPLLQTTDPPTPFAPPGITENARFRFAATAGQNLTLGFPTVTASGAWYVSVFRPTGSSVVSGYVCTSGVSHCRVVLANLPQTGTYGVEVQPPAGLTISGSVNLSADLVGTLSASSPVELSATRAGQVARYTFSGTVGDSTSIKTFGLTMSPNDRYNTVNLQVNSPTGTNLGSVGVSSTSGIINFGSLPSTGTYTVILDPTYGSSWAGSLELDPGIPISVDGPVVSPTSSAGEPLRYTFSATAGQEIDFGMTGLAYDQANTTSTGVSIVGPTGNGVISGSCFTSFTGCDMVRASAPATGTYSLLVSPPATAAITGGVFALSTPLAGSFVINDPSETVAITRPGQIAHYTFSGTAAQLLHLGWSSTSVSGGQTVAVSVLNPDGSSLMTGMNLFNGVADGYDLPSLPTSGIYTVVFDPRSAASMSASVSLTTR